MAESVALDSAALAARLTSAALEEKEEKSEQSYDHIGFGLFD